MSNVEIRVILHAAQLKNVKAVIATCKTAVIGDDSHLREVQNGEELSQSNCIQMLSQSQWM